MPRIKPKAEGATEQWMIAAMAKRRVRAVSRLMDIARHGKDGERAAAVQTLLERAYGKPKETVVVGEQSVLMRIVNAAAALGKDIEDVDRDELLREIERQSK